MIAFLLPSCYDASHSRSTLPASSWPLSSLLVSRPRKHSIVGGEFLKSESELTDCRTVRLIDSTIERTIDLYDHRPIAACLLTDLVCLLLFSLLLELAGVPVFCCLSAGIPTISKLLIHIYKLAKFCEKRKALPTTLWILH